MCNNDYNVTGPKFSQKGVSKHGAYAIEQHIVILKHYYLNGENLIATICL